MTTPTEREALIAEHQELNRSNYSEIEVEQLNNWANQAYDMLVADAQEIALLREKVAYEQALGDKHFAAHTRLQAEVADLKAIADSDDGAGGDGMRLVLRNRELQAEINGIRMQAPAGYVRQYAIEHLAKPGQTTINPTPVDATDIALYLAAGAQP